MLICSSSWGFLKVGNHCCLTSRIRAWRSLLVHRPRWVQYGASSEPSYLLAAEGHHSDLPNQGLDLAILPVFSSIVIGKESFMIHLVLIIGKNAQAKSSDVINHRNWPRISQLGFQTRHSLNSHFCKCGCFGSILRSIFWSKFSNFDFCNFGYVAK